MARGFLSGIIWGTVVGGLGTTALSLLTPLPPGASGAPEIADSNTSISVQEIESGDAPQIPTADLSDEDVPLIGLSEPEGEESQQVPDPEKDSADAPEVETPDVALDDPENGGDAPTIPDTADSDAGSTDLALAPEAPAAISAPEIDTTVPTQPSPEPEVVEEAPEEEAPVAVDAAPEVTDEPEETELAEAPAEAPEVATEIGEPVEEMTDKAPNVTTNRLPSIGAEEETVVVAPEEPAVIDGADALGALAWNAVPFDNPDGQPVFAVVLIEDADSGFGPKEAAGLGFPVTMVVDAASAGAEERAKAYRAVGHEVLFTLSVPENATATDVEVAFERAANVVPVAVGVMDRTENGFGSNRIVAQQVIAIAAQTGHAVIGHGRGLNSIEQIARRDNVPASLSFRVLDDQKQSPPVVRRYLDRAAFRAQQEGAVIVVGHTYPDSIAALMEWAVSERASSMALAPVSAALQ